MGQILLFGIEDFTLHLYGTDLHLIQAKKGKKCIDGSKHGIDAGKCITLLQQCFLVADDQLFGQFTIGCIQNKPMYITTVFRNGIFTFFFCLQIIFEL